MRTEQKHIIVSRIIKINVLSESASGLIHQMTQESDTINNRNKIKLISEDDRKTLMQACVILNELNSNTSMYSDSIESIINS